MSLFLVLIFIIFTLGLIIGSFLNVVILRFNTGMSIAKGRSACFSCAKKLAWYELLPVVSFFALKGKCRSCGTKLSWQYPLVELATGSVFILAYLQAHSITEFLLLAVLFCLYIVIFVYDLRHKIIPDLFSYSAGLIALGLVFLSLSPYSPSLFSNLLAGPILFTFFWFFWFVSKGKWMGLGDGKLALSVGWALGLSQGVSALLLAFWTGAIFAIALMAYQRIFLRKKGLGMKSAIPFGPFILVGFLIASVFNLDFLSLLSYLAL